MSDPADIGARVLAGLAAGREAAIAAAQARAAPRWRRVRAEIDRDILAGHGKRGRAVRIARILRRDMKISERQVRRILAALYSPSDSFGLYGTTTNHTGPDR